MTVTIKASANSPIAFQQPMPIIGAQNGSSVMSMQQGIKLSVIGGGSTYCPELFLHMIQSATLRNRISEVTLYDVNAERVAVVGGFCERLLRSEGINLKLNWTTDPEQAFRGAKILFNMMRAGQMEGRFSDEQIPLDYVLIGQETMGLGGFRLFHRQVEALTPLLPYFEAGVSVFNFANPSGMLSQWLRQATSAASMVFGLCNIPFGIKMEIARVLKAQRPDELKEFSVLEIANRVEIDSVGLNHYTFFRNFRFDGNDVTAEVIDGITRPPANFDVNGSAEDIASYPDILSKGIFPNWYYRYRMDPTKYEFEMRNTPPEKSRAWKVRLEENAILAEYRHSDKPISKILERLLARGGANYSLMAVLALEAVLENSGARQIVNTANRRPDGSAFIPWLSAETFVEVPSHMNAGGANVDLKMNVDLPIEYRQGVIAEAAAQNLWIAGHLEKDPTQRRILMEEALFHHPLIGQRLTGGRTNAIQISAIFDSINRSYQGLPPLVF